MRIFLVSITFLLASCLNSHPFYDKEFYERISGIKIPTSFKILEAIDNGEFLTATAFRANRNELRQFAEVYGFKPAREPNSLHFASLSYLKGDKPDLDNSNNYLYTSGTKGKNSWLYIIDLEKGLLWAEQQYPDAGGT
jgi:hypothetical protein